MGRPISETEMKVFLDLQIARLDDLTRPAWKKYRVPLQTVRFDRNGTPGELYIVARSGAEVLLYDDASDEFGRGTLDGEGVLHNWTTYGPELRATLRYFPSERPASR